jgi:hypothetical protein
MELEEVECSDCLQPAQWRLRLNAVFLYSTASISTTLWGEIASSFIGYSKEQVASFDLDRRFFF